MFDCREHILKARRLARAVSKITRVIDWCFVTGVYVANAAKLFVDFFLSKEGQTISQKQQYRVPANPDLPPVSPNLDPKNLKISLVNRQVAEKYEQFDKEYQELFVKGRAE